MSFYRSLWSVWLLGVARLAPLAIPQIGLTFVSDEPTASVEISAELLTTAVGILDEE